MFPTALSLRSVTLSAICLLLIRPAPYAVPPTATPPGDAFAWPTITSSSKPWTYWWWLGSTVDEVGLSTFLKRSSAAGLGGMHVIPIYGVKGLEESYVEYLSPRWLELLHFTVNDVVYHGMAYSPPAMAPSIYRSRSPGSPASTPDARRTK